MEQRIEFKNVTLGYKKAGADLHILQNLELSFAAGDFIGIAGLNGSGKSTLLKSTCGLLPVLTGEILVAGENVSTTSLSELSKKIAIVLTEKIGGFNLKAYDVVAAGQIPYTNAFHQLRTEHAAIIEAAISACGLRAHQYKPVNELSDGLFQKTVIAKALAQQTPAILLDEPTAFLDYASKHDLFVLLKRLAEKESKTVLVSSHDLDLILKYCTKVLVVSDKGARLLPVKEALSDAAFQKIGGGFL